MASFNDIINKVDLDESHDEFYETEPVVESVDADGMVAIIETIVGTNPQPTQNDENDRLKQLSDNLVETDGSTDDVAFKQNNEPKPSTDTIPEKAPTLNEPSQQNSQPDHPSEPVPINDEPNGLFDTKFPKIAERIKLRFKNAPEDLEKLMKFLNKKNVVAKISEVLTKIGNEPVMIDHKVVGSLVKYYNKNNKNQITLPLRDEDINDPNKQAAIITSIKIPNGFNQPPSALGEHCTSTRFGYPLINFGSETIKEMLKPASDLGYLKILTKEFVKEIKDTPIADALGTRTMLNTWKMIVKRVRECGRSKCIPALHKPLKISGNENINDLFNGSHNDDGSNTVAVHPINTRSNKITESVDNVTEDALMEGLLDRIKGGKASDTSKNNYIDGPEIDVPIPYLAQFYKVNKPNSPAGMEKYTRYMSEDDIQFILSQISEEAANAAKQSNTSYKAALLSAYVKENDGILPYYILTQRTEPKERIRITPKPLLRDLYLVKSVDGPNKAVGYFVSKEEREQLFELG